MILQRESSVVNHQ